MNSPLLQTEQLTVRIGNYTICQQLDLTLYRNQSYAILGNNGVGKTTLLQTLAGLLTPSSGTIYLHQQPLATYSSRQRAQYLGLLTQTTPSGLESTLWEWALLGRYPHLSRWQSPSPYDQQRAAQALADMALSPLKNRSTHTLSGGEWQRLKLAQLLTQAPQVYLLDEPANHLDWYYQAHILGYLKHYIQPQAGIIMTLHDINQAAQQCDHALLLWGNGETLHGPIEEILTAEHLSRLYGVPIVRCATEYGPLYRLRPFVLNEYKQF